MSLDVLTMKGPWTSRMCQGQIQSSFPNYHVNIMCFATVDIKWSMLGGLFFVSDYMTNHTNSNVSGLGQ